MVCELQPALLVFHASPQPLPLSATGWNELLIASFSHRSIGIKDGILLATGLHVHRNSAHSAGVGAIFDRSSSQRHPLSCGHIQNCSLQITSPQSLVFY